jgi:hypothetical protein
MVNLKNIKNIDKKAIVQYSYPIANITSSSPNVFSFRFNGFNPNFSASFNNNYISGVCVKATIAKKKHDIISGSNAELVLEHKMSNNTTFYVVVPLVFDASMPSSSNLKILFLNEEDRVLDLSAELKNKKNIFCYKNNTKAATYIFVFESPIFIENELPTNLTIFPVFKEGMKKNTGFRITNAQNIDNEIVCEYVTQTDVNATPADTKNLTTILSWAFFLLGVMLLLIYALKMIANKAAPDSANSLYMVLGVTGFILLIIYIRLFTTTVNKKIEYGSITIFSIMLLTLSLFAYNGYFNNVKI